MHRRFPLRSLSDQRLNRLTLLALAFFALPALALRLGSKLSVPAQPLVS